MIEIPPITLAELPADWIEERREVIAREGYAVRACESSFNIEAQSLRDGRWLRLPLPNNAPAFSTKEDRDAVLSELWRLRARIAKKEAT